MKIQAKLANNFQPIQTAHSQQKFFSSSRQIMHQNGLLDTQHTRAKLYALIERS